jgi:glutamine synthetase adenylyltransferase
MTVSAERRMRAVVSSSPLAERLDAAAEPLERLEADDRIGGSPEPVLAGVARAVAGQPEVGAFLSRRPGVLLRLASANASTLATRAAELDLWRPSDPEDLEGALDELRLLRREETCLAACLHFGGLVPFSGVSDFLSHLAETITRRALDLALRPVREPLSFAVIGMGKIAGREFTYHSDLDLLFLYEGDPLAIDQASRVGQRLVSYLTTMTGAGIAYPVDTRLRPSGRQGMLVTSLPAFERYQSEQAQTWEHVALLRARPIAGHTEAARRTLAHVHDHVCAAHESPWADLAAMRQRVESERAAAGRDGIAFKTGAGGLMDVDFLAGGGLLEAAPSERPALPSVPALLRAAVQGPAVESLLEDYAFLRRVEAAARWWAGRPVEVLSTEALSAAAELTQPGLGAGDLRTRLRAACRRIRSAWSRVVDAGTIRALEA